MPTPCNALGALILRTRARPQPRGSLFRRAAQLLAGALRHGLEVALVVIDLGLACAVVHAGLARAVVLSGLGNAIAVHGVVRLGNARAGCRKPRQRGGNQRLTAESVLHGVSP